MTNTIAKEDISPPNSVTGHTLALHPECHYVNFSFPFPIVESSIVEGNGANTGSLNIMP